MSRWASGRRCVLVWVLVGALGALGAPPTKNAARLVLRWKEVAQASAYELQIAKDSAFVEVVLQTRTTTSGYRWEELPTATHWWRVRSIDPDGRPSEWSAPRTIAVDSVVPELKTPADGAVLACGATVEVEAVASPLVSRYVLEVARSASFAESSKLDQEQPRFQLSALQTGTYFARLRAVDVRGVSLGPGPVRSFSVRVASPRPRAVGEMVLGAAQSVQLNWSEVACAQSYLVEAVNDGRDRASLSSNSASVAFKPSVAGEYRFRVAGVDAAGNAGEWSSETTFKLKLPPPVLKAEVLGTETELSWSSVPTAVSYGLELTSSGTAAPLTATVPASSAPRWKTPLERGAWVWRVNARDARGHVSAWSEPRRFERAPLEPLVAPELQSPDESVDDGQVIDLAWGDVAFATEYEVEVDGVVSVRSAAAKAQLVGLSLGWHALRVRALAPALGRSSAFSQGVEVCVGVIPAASVSVQLVGGELRVSLFDKHGHPTHGTPTFSVKRGALGEREYTHEQWVMAYRSPESGDDVLQVDDGALHVERVLERGGPTAWWFAAAAGGVFNGGAVASPTGFVAVGYRLPRWQRHVGIELRGAVFHSGSSAMVAGEAYRGDAWLLPVSALANYQRELGAMVLRGALGAAVVPIIYSVNDAHGTAAVPAVHIAASVSRRFGPGRVELEVDFLYGALDTVLARLNAGGVGIRVGYVFDFDD